MILRTLRDLLKGLALVLWNLVKLLTILVVLSRIALHFTEDDDNSS